MRRVGPEAADLEQFHRLGLVAAWRAGLAQYRRRGLEIAAELETGLLQGLFEAEGMGRDALLATLCDAPWDPIDAAPGKRRLRLVALVGAFRGLGGPFIEPPLVGSRGEQLIAWDREAAWEIHADRWGGVLVRSRGVDPVTLGSSRSQPLVDERGRMRFRGEEAQFPLAGHSSAAAAGGTLAVTLPDSHQIFLFAVAGRGLDG